VSAAQNGGVCDFGCQWRETVSTQRGPRSAEMRS
jgi:hypothetical protein